MLFSSPSGQSSLDDIEIVRHFTVKSTNQTYSDGQQNEPSTG